MARKPRLHVPGGVYHVMLRGNGWKNIFYTQIDRDHLEELVGEGVIRYGHRIHAYCWMRNHIHLAIQVAEEPLSKIVQNYSFRYARWLNNKNVRLVMYFKAAIKLYW